MHRQSLGSPSSKLHNHNHGVMKEEEVEQQEEPPKTHRLSSPPLTPHKNFVHLIPILTLFCFFVLYLSSHPPSPSDMDQFTLLKRRHHHHLESAMEKSEIEQHYVDGKRSDVIALRSLRNLQQIRLHRKLADF